MYKKSVFIYFLFIFISFFSFKINNSDKIKVACIGNSITYGFGIKNPKNNAYPAQLNKILGDSFLVKNFGVNGATALKKGNKPYWDQKAFKKSLKFNPDIVIIQLGTNDTKPKNWKFKASFKEDYVNLIEKYSALKTKPDIYICLPVPVIKDRWGISKKVMKNEIRPVIKNIAANKNVKMINLYKDLKEKADLFHDNIHPNKKGAKKMAKIIANQLSK